MCTACLLFSTLMLFTPAGNAAPANRVSVAQETQVAITQMVKQLPKSSDTKLLRSGLLELHSQLATTKNDVQAQCSASPAVDNFLASTDNLDTVGVQAGC